MDYDGGEGGGGGAPSDSILMINLSDSELSVSSSCH